MESSIQVLLVAGTHGNEINAPWLFQHWNENSDFLSIKGVNVITVIGNPAALNQGRRYIDRDLNRSFSPELLTSLEVVDQDVQRAREMIDLFGENGVKPCNIAIDFHSTTAAMGTCLVVYGRRKADLALAALIQHNLGLPIYLHEGDKKQTGFLVEAWPCGLVVEIGPVPQGLLDSKIINQTRIAVEVVLDQISKVKTNKAVFPDQIFVHRHLRSLDFPRNSDGVPDAVIHPNLQGKDWRPIKEGTPLFLKFDGTAVHFDLNESLVPVFINEAAYSEKNIAMSLTISEKWPFSKEWERSLRKLILN